MFTIMNFVIHLINLVPAGLSQDCNTVKCPDIDSCPEGTEPVLLNATNSGDIYDECCEAFECKPSKNLIH